MRVSRTFALLDLCGFTAFTDQRGDREAVAVLALRGGICTGEVIMFEGDDYIGAAGNVAARLCWRAEPGQLLLTAQTAAVAVQHLRPTALGSVTVPGVSTPVDVLALDPAPAAA